MILVHSTTSGVVAAEGGRHPRKRAPLPPCFDSVTVDDVITHVGCPMLHVVSYISTLVMGVVRLRVRVVTGHGPGSITRPPWLLVTSGRIAR